MLKLSTEALDLLTRSATALDSFQALLDSKHGKHGWFPTLDLPDPEVQLLADLYDEEQERRGDPRRAWRGSHPDTAHVPLIIRRAQRICLD